MSWIDWKLVGVAWVCAGIVYAWRAADGKQIADIKHPWVRRCAWLLVFPAWVAIFVVAFCIPEAYSALKAGWNGDSKDLAGQNNEDCDSMKRRIAELEIMLQRAVRARNNLHKNFHVDKVGNLICRLKFDGYNENGDINLGSYVYFCPWFDSNDGQELEFKDLSQ